MWGNLGDLDFKILKKIAPPMFKSLNLLLLLEELELFNWFENSNMFWTEMQKGIVLVVHQFFTDMHDQIFYRYAKPAIFQNICLGQGHQGYRGHQG